MVVNKAVPKAIKSFDELDKVLDEAFKSEIQAGLVSEIAESSPAPAKSDKPVKPNFGASTFSVGSAPTHYGTEAAKRSVVGAKLSDYIGAIKKSGQKELPKGRALAEKHMALATKKGADSAEVAAMIFTDLEKTGILS